MDINNVFPSKWLKAGDLQGRNIKVTMENILMEEVADDKKPVLYFQGKTKGLVLNKTNANAIAGMYGPDTDNWKGRAIVIFPTQVDYAGKPVQAIRVQMTKPAAADETPEAPLEDDPAEQPDPDYIPF